MFSFLRYKSKQTRIQACLNYLFLSENADTINAILRPNIQKFAKQVAPLNLSPETLATIQAAKIMRDTILMGFSDERRLLIVKLFDSKIFPGMELSSKDIPEKDKNFLESFFTRISHIEIILNEWKRVGKITQLTHDFFVKEIAASLKGEEASINEEILELIVQGL